MNIKTSCAPNGTQVKAVERSYTGGGRFKYWWERREEFHSVESLKREVSICPQTPVRPLPFHATMSSKSFVPVPSSEEVLLEESKWDPETCDFPETREDLAPRVRIRTFSSERKALPRENVRSVTPNNFVIFLNIVTV